jgi:hypothetical protein
MLRACRKLPRRPLSSVVRAALVFAVMMPVVAVDLRAAEPAMKTHEAAGVRLEIPADWEVAESEGTIFSAREPQKGPDDQFYENIRLVTREVPASTTLDQVLSVQTTGARTEYDILGSGHLHGGAHPMAWLAIAPKSDEDGARPVMVSYYYVNGGRSYALNAMTARDNYDSYRPIFEKVARSVALPGGVIPPSPVDPARQKAREGGEAIGNWTFKLMMAVVVVFGLKALFRRLFGRSRTVSEVP